MDHKPFNLDHAKAGAPVVTRAGLPVRICCFDVKATHFILLSLVTTKENLEEPLTSDRHGCELNSTYPGQDDLLMAPLGYVDGKPVFWGDSIQYKLGGEDTVWLDMYAGHSFIEKKQGGFYAFRRPFKKIKREVWVNCLPLHDITFSTYQQAVDYAKRLGISHCMQKLVATSEVKE